MIGIQDDPQDGRPCFEPGRIADVDASECFCQPEGTWVCFPTSAGVLSPIDSGGESNDGGGPDVSADPGVDADATVDQYAVDANVGVDEREAWADVPTADSTDDSPSDGTLVDAVGDTTPSDAARDYVSLVDASLDGAVIDAAQVDGGDATVADGSLADAAFADSSDAGVGDSDTGDAPMASDGSSDASCVCLQVQQISWQTFNTYNVLSVCNSYTKVANSSGTCGTGELACQDPLLAQLNSQLSQLDADASGSQPFFDSALTENYLFIILGGGAMFELLNTCPADASCPQSSVLAGIASTLEQIELTELANSPCSSNNVAEAGEAGMSDVGQD